MQGNSRSVSTNQPDIHDKIDELVLKYLKSDNKKPIQAHTESAFQAVVKWLKTKPSTSIMLDSCCGVGESTWRLAKQNPNHLVIGIDKSAVRIKKHGCQDEYADANGARIDEDEAPVDQESNEVQIGFHENYCVVRADVIDFWRLVAKNDWQVSHHFIFYPNPYPKASQVQKRWHATASFKDILNIGGELTVRSNWEIYIREFARALTVANKVATVSTVEQVEAFTPFERKYWNSGQSSWQVTCRL